MIIALLSPALAGDGCEALDPYLVALDMHEGCTTVVLGALAENARAQGLESCLEPALLSRGFPVPGAPQEHELLPPPPSKTTYDSLNGFSESLESENFIIRWNDGYNEDSATRLAEILEGMWAHEIGKMGYSVPSGLNSRLMNVYVKNEDIGAAAYVTLDSYGNPYMVWNADSARRQDEDPTTSSHEFFHAIQFGLGTHDFGGTSAWYWEATATWMESQAVPTMDEYTSAFFGWGYVPHQRLDTFAASVGSDWGLENYHQYGAFIWATYLTEHTEDGVDFIRYTWTDPDGDPLEAAEALLAAEGVDIIDLFGQFAATTAVLDYKDRAGLEDSLASREDVFPNNFYARTIEGDTNGEYVRSYDSVNPEPKGINFVKISDLEGHDLTVGFKGDAESSSGRPGHWRVWLARPDGAYGRYEEIPLQNERRGEITIEGGVDEADEWILAIAQYSAAKDTGTWGYEVFVDTDKTEVVDTGDPEPTDLGKVEAPEEGCGGCASPGSLGLGLGLAALGLARRRR